VLVSIELVKVEDHWVGAVDWGSGTEEGCMFIEIRVKEVVHSGSGAVSEKDGLHL
jgi:hypothetical protein